MKHSEAAARDLLNAHPNTLIRSEKSPSHSDMLKKLCLFFCSAFSMHLKKKAGKRSAAVVSYNFPTITILLLQLHYYYTSTILQ